MGRPGPRMRAVMLVDLRHALRRGRAFARTAMTVDDEGGRTVENMGHAIFAMFTACDWCHRSRWCYRVHIPDEAPHTWRPLLVCARCSADHLVDVDDGGVGGVSEAPLEWVTVRHRTCGDGIALRYLGRPRRGDTLHAWRARYADGRGVSPGEWVVCDACGCVVDVADLYIEGGFAR